MRAPAPLARPPASPKTARAESRGIAVEMALADEVFAPGDVIRGHIAVMRDHEGSPELLPSEVRVSVSVVGVERVSAPGEETNGERLRFPAELDTNEVSGGRPARFARTLPSTVPLTHFTEQRAHFWIVEARAALPFYDESGVDVHCEIPILVLPLEGPPVPAAEEPPIGIERQRRAWADAGAPYGLVLDEDGLRLKGKIAGSTAAIGYVDFGLAAEIRYADLGLGLRLRGVLADGRDAEQIRAAFDPEVGRALSAFGETDMNDHRAIVRSRWGSERDMLTALIGDVAALAGWIGVLRRRIRPPAAMAASLPAYRALAAKLGAPLTEGSMSIRGGTLDGERFDVTTVFKGAAPDRTAVCLHLSAPLDAPLDPADPDALASLPDEARRLVIALGTEAESLREEDGALKLVTHGVELDGERLASLVRDLARLRRLLRERRGGGPYR